MSWHRKTDPACFYYKEPRTLIQHWRFDRNRGRSCETCQVNRAQISMGVEL